MLVTLSGITMLVKLVQTENAYSPMLVTGLPIYLSGITISVLLQEPIPVTVYPPSSFSVYFKPNDPILSFINPQEENINMLNTHKTSDVISKIFFFIFLSYFPKISTF